MSYFDPAPSLTKSYPDGRLTLNETGMRTVPVAIEVIREFVAKHNLLVDLYEWALDACSQGSGAEFQSSPTWHSFISTWEDADELLPRVREAVGQTTP